MTVWVPSVQLVGGRNRIICPVKSYHIDLPQHVYKRAQSDPLSTSLDMKIECYIRMSINNSSWCIYKDIFKSNYCLQHLGTWLPKSKSKPNHQTVSICMIDFHISHVIKKYTTNDNYSFDHTYIQECVTISYVNNIVLITK